MLAVRLKLFEFIRIALLESLVNLILSYVGVVLSEVSNEQFTFVTLANIGHVGMLVTVRWLVEVHLERKITSADLLEKDFQIVCLFSALFRCISLRLL